MGSDGASVNIGKKGGVAALLRHEVPHMIDFHCLPHRLELALLEMQKSCKLVSTIYDVLQLIWKTVSHVIPRGHSYSEAASFADRVEILQQYLDVVLSPIPNVFCWVHRAFSHPGKDFYLPDGVHVNPAGQYHLYRSYRGAIFRALCLL